MPGFRRGERAFDGWITTEALRPDEMSPTLDPGALLARHYALPEGPRVCLRLARPRDRDGIRELFDAHGWRLDELEPARVLSFDVTRRLVLVATALIGATEAVVGVGTIELNGPVPDEPTVVLAAEALRRGVEPLLRDALVGHAATIVRARAA
jgi:hypothetical protein